MGLRCHNLLAARPYTIMWPPEKTAAHDRLPVPGAAAARRHRPRSSVWKPPLIWFTGDPRAPGVTASRGNPYAAHQDAVTTETVQRQLPDARPTTTRDVGSLHEPASMSISLTGT